MKKQLQLDHIFFPLSKIIIAISLLVIIIALVLKLSGNQSLSYTAVMPTPTVVIQPTATPLPPRENIKANIDLTGPYKCEGKNGNSSALIYIKNKNIYAVFTESSVKKTALLKGDCLYSWTGTVGEKTCGMTEYVALFESLTSMGMVSINSIMASVSSTADNSATREAFMKETIASCRKEPVADTVFVYPGGITFKEVKVNNDLQNILPQ